MTSRPAITPRHASASTLNSTSQQRPESNPALLCPLYKTHQTLPSVSPLTLTMAPSSSSSSSALSLSLAVVSFFFLASLADATILTLVNNCAFTVWPAIQPNAGHPVLARGGFVLHSLTHISIPIPDRHWSGRVWARTGCGYSGNQFLCATGDCGGRLECNGAGGATPASLAQFSVHHGPNDYSSYGVSFVDGFNIPMTVTPHEGKGVCPVVGCRVNLLDTCPPALQHRVPQGHGPVMACKSGCEAFRTDELCCRNQYNSPQMCKPSLYSEFFKHACPATFTYAHDNPSLMHECSSPRELKVIFCH